MKKTQTRLHMKHMTHTHTPHTTHTHTHIHSDTLAYSDTHLHTLRPTPEPPELHSSLISNPQLPVCRPITAQHLHRPANQRSRCCSPLPEIDLQCESDVEESVDSPSSATSSHTHPR